MMASHCSVKLLTFLTCLNYLGSYADGQQNCLQASNGDRPLPDFVRPGGGGEPRFRENPMQAIITSYRFNCCGVVTEWRAFVERSGGGHAMAYTISFQVWRPNSSSPVSNDGCYNMTGVNHFSPIPLADDKSADRGIVTGTVPESERIEVQPGDVVGFYLESSRRDDDGIQFAGDDDNDIDYTGETVWYAAGSMLGSSECLFPSSALDSFTNRAPLVTVTVVSSECPVTSSTPPIPAPTPSPGHFSTSSQISSMPLPDFTIMPSSDLTVLAPTSSQDHSSTPSPPDATSTPSPDFSSTPSLSHSSTSSPTPSTTGTLSPSNGNPPASFGPPSIISNSIGLVVGLAVALFTVIVIAALAIVLLVVVIFRKKKGKKSDGSIVSATAMSNPNYEEVATSVNSARDGQGSGSESSRVRPINSIYDTLEGDYQVMLPTPSRIGNPQTNELSPPDTDTYYAEGPDIRHQYDSCGTGPVYQYLEPSYEAGSGQNEDSINQSTVETSTQNKDPFESEGIYVPTLAQRQSMDTHYEFQEDLRVQMYNKLQFFVDDDIYWAPADTASDLYQQLASKKYREIPRDQLKILKQLGSGQFGEVHKGVWSTSGNSLQLAVKTLKPKGSEADKVKFLQEAAIMGQFLHPNVVKLYGVVTVGEPVMICLEIMPNRDLSSYLTGIDLSSINERTSQDLQLLFLRFAKEIATGMNYLSKKAFVHRDLAARNVLVNDALTCKIGDFGMARDLMDDTYYTSHGGKIPVKWTAPEALLYQKYSTDSDVWSYGMVLFEIWSVGQKPFSNRTNSKVLELLQSRYVQCPPPGCPREIYQLMVDCWNPEHQYRPRFGVICSRLHAPATKLLYWSPRNNKVSKKASVLGAPLEEGYNLHQDLREKYKS